MKSTSRWAILAGVILAMAGMTSSAFAQAGSVASRSEISVMGGIHALNQNDTALPDGFLNLPVVGSLTYRLTDMVALEGEFTWMIPVEQSVEISGVTQDRKSPDILAYQASLRASRPLNAWTPYLAAGLGAVTFLSNTDANRVPRLSESQSAFAVNFGAGLLYGLNSTWGVRADFRELAAFPSSDAAGLSTAGNADPLWMERATVGLSYRF